MREILWIVPKWPFPAQDGARVATAQLLENLARRGHAIDLLAVAGRRETVSAEEARSKLGVRHVLVVRREDAGGSPLTMIPSLLASPLIPLTFRNYHAKPVRDALERILSGDLAPWLAGGTAPSHRPDWYGVVYDGLHPAIHSSRHGIFAKPSFPPRVFYRAHNYETDLWERKAARTVLLPLRWFFRFQASRVRAFERSLLELSSGTAPVSEDDWKCFLKLDPAA
ncbi:MAG TPA: hypothetical protein VM598_08815, partial [Bdellovibrionota bacterium]|nr:hypothetical protein [Bdellovibrionota bacterium]